MSKPSDAAWFAKNFPTPHAREAADKAIDKLDPNEPLTAFLDLWIQVYIQAGGKTKLKL